MKTTEVSHNYFARITLPDGKRKSVPLCSDYTHSEQMLTDRLYRSNNPAIEFLFAPGVRATLARIADAEDRSIASLTELLVKEALSARGELFAAPQMVPV